MAGIIMEPTAAVLALELPEIPAKNMDDVTETMGRPPRRRPTIAMARLEIPHAFISSPARMNNGTAISAQESRAAKALCAMTSRGICPFTSKAAAPLKPMPKATGTPRASRRTRLMKTAAIINAPLPPRDFRPAILRRRAQPRPS